MNTNVVYISKTGHSRKIAQAVAESIGTKALDAALDPDVHGTDLLFVVSGIYAGKAEPRLSAFLSKLQPDDVRRVAFITSSLSKSRQEDGRRTLADTGIPAARDEYSCMGSFLFFGRKHPDGADIQGAIDFALQLMETTDP